MRLADALVEALIALDVKYVFGVSGANIEHLHDAIHRRGGKGRLVSVLAKSEDGAGYMADCYARVNRRLGVACSTSGGGMMNLIAGIAESYQSSVPVLAIVGQPPASVEGRGAFQDSSGIGRSVNAMQMFSAVSKYCRKVDRPEVFWESFADGVAAALSGRPGPAVLLFPRSVYMTEVGDVPATLAEDIARRTAPRVPTAGELRAILDELRMARRPVLIVGQGVQRTLKRTAVVEFAKALSIPVATTMAARGEFPNDHPSYLGILGVAGHPSVHAFIRDQCDLLLLAGAGLNTMTRAPFARDPVDLPEKRIVAISTDLGELERVVMVKAKTVPEQAKQNQRSWWPNAVNSVAVGVEADAGATFEALHELWKEAPFQVRTASNYLPMAFSPTLATSTPMHGTAIPAFIREGRAPTAAELDPNFDDGSESPLSHPLALRQQLTVTMPSSSKATDDSALLQSVALDVLADHLPAKGSIIYDAGNCAAAALHAFPIPAGVSAVTALGMGAMGYGIAAAIGAQLGAPRGSRTMVFTGDGSYLMLGTEVHTAVDFGLPILFVVFNNNMHGMCATRQNVFFESRYEAVTYGPVDIAQISRGFGSPDRLWVAKASTRRELVHALEEFAKEPLRTGVLELMLRIEEVPPFAPFLDNEAPTQPALRIPSLRPKSR